MLQMLMGFYSVSFRLDNTILPALYVLLNLESDFPYSQSWFESFYKKLLYQAFRRCFLNFEHQNERYQEHFFNDFLGHTHSTTSCDICIEHDSIHFSQIILELSHFKASYFDEEDDTSKFCPFTHTYEQDNQLFQTFTPAVLYHKCTTSCMLQTTS